ncbi:transport and Golgi organization protein 1 homolog isoform X2 [Xyrichtys novacula]|uniref:Transport and Golgi organization protein 1 homolog n=1 Tax=Xyrichtys novacula TaxID=13765 RepID=A0AAV1GTW2_XYRNO|nr:transport and Golgi organization protein 1 homolog isoform X2 [Xyrichtys novacula]
MAAKHFYKQGFLLLLFNFISTAALEKRFSDLKRCADEECSMLLVRGKALKDFSGPDCRFLKVKQSETIYVYYKLSGRRPGIWAGSIGTSFGYFPSDLLAVNHIYTEKEIEVAAEETDFVCFDTGFDKFNNYDVDSLLGSSAEEDEGKNEETSDQTEKETENQGSDQVPDDPSASLHEPDTTSESSSNDPDTPDAAEQDGDHTDLEPEGPETGETKDTPVDPAAKVSESVSSSEGVQIPELKTTFGTTFDAVISDEEITKKVTPYEEEDGEEDETPPTDETDDDEEGTPLISYSKETTNTPAEDSVKVSEGKQIPELKTTFGTTFDAVVSDGEITKKVTPHEEEESEDMDAAPDEEDVNLKEETPLLSFSEDTGNTPASDSTRVSEGTQIPRLKTTLATTFDAVVSDGEITQKTTPEEEDQSQTVEDLPENDDDVKDETPLLSFSEDGSYTENISEGVKIPRVKTSYGSTMDAVVSDEEVTTNVTPNEEEEESEDTESPPDEETEVRDETPLLSSSHESEESVGAYTEKLSVGAQIPKLKTNLGSTFDAVVSDEERTKKTSPHEEEEEEEEEEDNEKADDLSSDKTDGEGGTPLLSFSDQPPNTPSPASPEQDQSPSSTHEENPETAEEKGNIWTTFGDAVFSVVTGGERTEGDFSSEEDDDDDDEEEKEDTVSGTPQTKEKPVVMRASKDQYADDVPHHLLSKKAELADDHDDEDDGEVVGPEEAGKETLKPTDEPIQHQTEEKTPEDPETKDDRPAVPAAPTSDTGKQNQPEEKKKEEDLKVKVVSQESDIPKTEKSQEKPSKTSEVHDKEKMVADSLPNETYKRVMTESEDIHPRLSEPEEDDDDDDEEGLEELFPDMKEEEDDPEVLELDEELLEDENARSSPEPEYSDSIMRLTLLRQHLAEEKMEKVLKLLGLKNLFKVEAMFSDMDTEMKATRLSLQSNTQEIESTLEGILEASENTILDEIEKMLDSRNTKHNDEHADTSGLDEETEILDDFQELAFSLRQKYSTASDSTPLAVEKTADTDKDELHKHDMTEEDNMVNVSVAESDDNLTDTDHVKRPADTTEDQVVWDDIHSGPDVNMQEDSGHFNKNKDNKPSFSVSEEMQRVPQDTLENPLDMGLGVEVEHSSSGSSGSLDSVDPVSKVNDEEGLMSTGVVYMSCILSMMTTKFTEWTTVMISLLPDDWKPGETLYGCPWQAVVTTAVIGVLTFTLFFWRTVLAVKKKQFLVDEKKLSEQIQAFRKEKEDALTRMSELQKQTERLKEKQKQSKEEVSCSVKRVQDLESKVLEAEKRNERIAEEKNKYAKLLQEEQENSQRNGTRIEKLEKANEKLQLSRKKIQDVLAKTTVLLDEAKIREDARNAHQKSLEKDFTALKEENKTLKANIKSWEEKHKELNEQIKVYQKSQKELEDSVVLKDHNVEVLSELLADLDACDSQKGDAKVLANGEVAPDKKTAIKNRIKQMMDVSRVQTTLAVVEEERDRFMSKLMNEEKSRKSLEEQHQELEHSIATLKSEKSHVENQFKILQQKNEIMVEMYQQKENALQQKLTKEELERRSKESMLSEVGGKAVEAEEQVKVLRQRINEMEEQMKKTEVVYKEQIKEQENKTHSNWVNARNAERALNQEKLESSKLKEKLAVLTSQLNERRAPLFRPNSGQPSGPRQGDSYGPSPVSGGAPSPPIMIEGPRRPPSAPVGRRIDPYGPRPPSDPHGRYAENKHISGMDMMGPRSSSPANMDGSGPGSFLVSPIRDSPGPMVQGPPPGPGPHDQILPPGPHSRLPPPGPYRPPRPGPYHLPPGPHGPPPPNVPPLHGPPLPANGHPGMPMPGPMGGEYGPRPTNGHVFLPRPGPGLVMDPRGPPPPQFRPPPHHFGPMPPPHGIRGPMGPRPPIPPDMRFPGPRDPNGPPMNLPTGIPPHPAHHGDPYGQAPPDALQNSAGAHSGPGQGPNVKQEAPQDSGRPAMVKP